MTSIDTLTANIECPKCGSHEFAIPDAAHPDDPVICIGCRAAFGSRRALFERINREARKHRTNQVAETLNSTIRQVNQRLGNRRVQ